MSVVIFFFFFNDTATTEIYTLSLHDALPIFDFGGARASLCARADLRGARAADGGRGISRAGEVRFGRSRGAGRVFARIGGRKSGAIYAHAAFGARSSCGITGIRQRPHRGAFGAW